MRKTSYVVSFFAVLLTLVLNLFSLRRPDWLVVTTELFNMKEIEHYGLTQYCDLKIMTVPGMPNGSDIRYTDYNCRPFPARVADACEKENHYFCIVWTTAGFFSELAAGFAALSCLALVFGVTTHSRRRRIWRAVAALVAIHALLLIATFAIVTDTYVNNLLPIFQNARPGVAYVLGTVAWVLAVLVTFGVVVTGMAASRGHRWAAGNRAYEPIQG
ncbi:hypothetical protein NM688_g5500 [Phlebia brevispora]|uniref:Uncharacterized protein n=1 Tax=Phlebia brevispora TaxID=194682 RepID=A0ACC1SU82_9APHY|nr:hypothetical protein NM688_g5500 [Phlebia brevispora]